MINPAVKILLTTIKQYEGGPGAKGYGQIYGGAKGVPKDTDCSKLTLSGVLDLQDRMRKAGSASTACGGYQFIRKTLIATMQAMGLTGSELWDADLQDRMAIHLMKGRGLDRYMAGQISPGEFCNNLAKEWASLPVVVRIKGQKRMVDAGESYYAGDGLNKSHHDWRAIYDLVKSIRDQPTSNPAAKPVDAPSVGSAPMAPPPAPKPVAVAPIPPRKQTWWEWLWS